MKPGTPLPKADTSNSKKGFSMQTDTNLIYLVAAFSAVWIILFAYLVHLKKRSASLAEQLRNLSDSAC